MTRASTRLLVCLAWLVAGGALVSLPACDSGTGGRAPAGSGGTTGGSGTGGSGTGGGGTGGGATGGSATGGSGAIAACPGGATFDYTIRSLVTAEETETDGAAMRAVRGFDLDGLDSDGSKPEDCSVADFATTDGRRGIDNSIAGLWAEDFSRLFELSIASGKVPTSIRLSGVDNFDHDDCIDIAWSYSVLPPGAVGPEWQFRRARIDAGTVLADGIGVVEIGARFVPQSDPSPLSTALFPLELPRIELRPTPDGQLARGVVGGRVRPAHVVSAYRTAFSEIAPVIAPQVESILARDLAEGSQPCALLSAGFGFEAVRTTPAGP
jgi:hypothetical protein